MIGHFLPYRLAVGSGLVNTGIEALDLGGDGADHAEAFAVRYLRRGRRSGTMRGAVFCDTAACMYDRSAALEGSELKVSYFAGYRFDKRR